MANNEKIIWDFLMDKINNPYGVAGLMGNLYAESGLNPTNLQNTFNKKLGMTDEVYTLKVDEGSYNNFVKDGAGYGIAQWTYWTRKRNLLNYARTMRTSVGDLMTQLEFLWDELQKYTAVTKVLYSCGSIQEASDVVLTKFERPANMGDSVKKKRAAYGQRIFDRQTGVKEQVAESEPTPVVTKAKKKVVKITGTAVYIRKYASKYSKVLGTVKKGEEFEWILDGMNENSGWRAIRYKGDHAWVSAQYSKVVEK